MIPCASALGETLALSELSGSPRMEWVNDSGLRGSDADSDDGGYLGPPEAQRDQMRCRCAEQQGPCIYCRLGWLRAESDHSTAQATTDPRVVYAETAARQLEAQIAELGGRLSTEVAAKHPSGTVSSPPASSRGAGHVHGDDAPLPDWLVDMIQNPSQELTSRSASPYRQSTGTGRGGDGSGGGGGGGAKAPRNHRQKTTASDKAGRGARDTRKGTAGPISSRAGASSLQQRLGSRQRHHRPAAQRGKSCGNTGERSASGELKLTHARAKSRPSALAENDPSLEPQFQSARSRPSSPKDLGIGTQGEIPKSPARHPRPWSPPSAGRSLHFADKPTDPRDQDRERRREATRLAKGATMKRHAKSRVNSGRGSSSTPTHYEYTRETDASAISDLVEEVSRLRRENHALRGGEVSTELVRLRKETQSLRAALTEQKKVFRWQLSRIREEKRTLQEQIVALHAEKHAGAWIAPAAGTQAGAQRHKDSRVARASSPARSNEFDVPGQCGSRNEHGGDLSPNTTSPTLNAESRSDKVSVEEING